MNTVAQLATEMNPLAQYGLLGVVLGYFMYQGTKVASEIRGLAHRIDGLTRALLMDLVTRDSTGPATRAAAQQEITKIEQRQNKA